MNTFHEQFAQRVIVAGVMPAIMGISLFISGCASVPPPSEQMAVSKAAVTGATSAGSNEFAPLELKSATEKMNAAEKALAEKENLRALRLAEQAEIDAKVAETKTALAKAQAAVNNAKESNRVLREELSRGAP